QSPQKLVSFRSVIIQIALLDIVFSLDSVITAVGMSQHLSIMVLANIIALVVMIFTSRSIGNFVERHPTIKMLALSFLILIGLVLVLEAAGQHIPKAYIYFAMGFSVCVEMLNLRSTARKEHIK
ncbi:MAG: TerC family protein, partial [Proteobacteria bacterium]|nr:TerC family protein [Pseudomonadota bacterium]